MGPRGSAGGFLVRADLFGTLIAATDSVEIKWEPGAERFVRNRLALGRRHSAALAALRSLVAGGRDAAEAVLGDIVGLDDLDDHQVVNVAAMAIPDSPGLCIFDEQGTGKTVVTIFGFDALVSRREVDFLLVLAPKSMVPEWVRLRPVQGGSIRRGNNVWRSTYETGGACPEGQTSS